MAMGHPLPGLDIRKVDRTEHLYRAASAPPDIHRLREMLRPLDPKECENIKTCARNDWLKVIKRSDGSVTTYSGLHHRKILDQPTQNRVRPSSPTRLNKPHPPNVFLVTRLKHIKGCFNSEQEDVEKFKETGREKLEKYIRSNRENLVQAKVHHPRISRPKTTGSNVKSQETIIPRGTVAKQATEAWIKLSNDKEATQISKKIEIEENKRLKQIASRRRRPISLHYVSEEVKRSQNIYSANRWMKKAGREENDAVTRLIEALRNAPRRQLPTEGPHFHITDYSSMFGPAPKPPQYDFQIHPEWHTPWHKQYVKDNMVF